MNPESLGGHKNPYETKRPSDARPESQEAMMAFEDFRKKFNRQACLIFTQDHSLMTELRSDTMFQGLKTRGDHADQEGFESLARQFPDMRDAYDLEDIRDQAALLSVLAQVDLVQDDMLRKQALRKRAA